MRWPFGPPHLTLKPSKKKQKAKKTKKQKQIKKRSKNKRKQRTKNKEITKIPKELFSYQSIFSFFWWVSKISLFWQLDPKSAHPKNTIKIGVSATHFVENSSESRNGHFWTKKAKSRNSSYHYFGPFPSFTTTKNTKLSWNPYFYSVLTDLKKDNFQNLNLKHRKLKNPIFAPFFWKRQFLENCQIIGNKKTHTQW